MFKINPDMINLFDKVIHSNGAVKWNGSDIRKDCTNTRTTYRSHRHFGSGY